MAKNNASAERKLASWPQLKRIAVKANGSSAASVRLKMKRRLTI
jgi:hypothetical protein